MFYKAARVEYHPVGVVGAIVPWNYPFHNVFNPLTAALFAGNALVIKVRPAASETSKRQGGLGACGAVPLDLKAHRSACLNSSLKQSWPVPVLVFMGEFACCQVSEHASWSSLYYGRIISAALEAVGEACCLFCCTVQVRCCSAPVSGVHTPVPVCVLCLLPLLLNTVRWCSAPVSGECKVQISAEWFQCTCMPVQARPRTWSR